MDFVKNYKEFKEEEQEAIKMLQEAIRLIESGEIEKYELNESNVDEGLFKTLAAGTAGLVIGPHIGEAICKALGIGPGLLKTLLTSKAFNALFAGYVASK